MKKVIIVQNSMKFGGVEKSLIEFLKVIIKLPLEIDVMVPNEPLTKLIPNCINMINIPKSICFREIKQNFRDYTISEKKHMILIYIAKYLKLPSWRFFLPNKRHYDVAIAYTTADYTMEYVIDKISAENKFLFFHHGEYVINSKTKHDLKYFSKFDRLVFVSEDIKNKFINMFPQFANKSVVVYNIIDCNEIIKKANESYKLPVINRNKIFLTVGRYHVDKGINLIPQIAHEVKKAGFTFKWLICGSGDYPNSAFEQKLKEDIVEFNVLEEVILLGNVINPYPYFKLCDLYIQPSRIESFGITIAEATQFNVPIIATNLDVFVELFKNYKQLHLVDFSTQAFAQSIIKFLKSKNTMSGDWKYNNDKTKLQIEELFNI